MSAFYDLRTVIASAGDVPRFRPDEVPTDLVAELLTAAAPRLSGRFVEAPWRSVVVVGREREQLVARLAEALARHWGLGPLAPRGLASDAVLDAPVLLLLLSAVPSSEGLEPFGVVAGVAQNVTLLAQAAGLATHRIYGAHVVPEAVLDFVGERLGPSLRRGELVAMLALGWPAVEEQPVAAAGPPAPGIGWIGRDDAPPAPPAPEP